MINLNPAATTAAPSALGGVPDAAAGGDFLAMLAGIVGSVTSAASPDGDGVLLPGSPLLDAADGTAGDLVADLAAEFGAILDAEVVTDAEVADGEVAGFPWPTVQALAAMLAQPAAAAPLDAAEAAAATEVSAGSAEAAVPAAGVGTGTNSPLPGPAPAAAGTAGAGTMPDTVASLSPTDAAPTDVVATTPTAATAATDATAATAATAATGAAATTDAVTDVAAEATTETAEATTARTAPGPTRAGEATADATAATSVADAAADADAGEPVRVEAARRSPDADFRPARTGTADTLADPVQATGELRDTGSTVRDRGPMTSAAAGVARVLDAIEQLEKAPPPRQVTLELGDVRVRVAVEDGAVRMQLLGEQRDAGRDFLRAASEALRERGFEMAGEGKGDARDRDAERQRPDLAPPRPERGFGRTGRATDPTTAGVRAGIHL